MVRENRRGAFELAWWPIDLAIAWVLTRDRTFVERQWKRSRDGLVGISVAIAADRITGKCSELRFEGTSEAWTELKAALEEGRIEVAGTPFKRVADLSGAAVETSDSQRTISDAEIGSLMLQEEGDEVCLVPEDWRIARGSNWNNLRGYRNVQVRTNGVLHFFPSSANVKLPSEYLAPPKSPHLPGEMAISQAAYWIASEGGTSPFDFRDEAKWKAAFSELLPRISTGLISVVGRRHGRGLAVSIEAVNFAGIAIDYPYSESPLELLFCERPHIQCYGVVDDDEWEKGFSDVLMGDDRRVPEFSHLQVRNADLAREFPFADSVPAIARNGFTTRTDRRTVQSEIRDVARRLWPDGKYPARIKERDQAIQAEFKIPPHARTIRRALNSKD